MTNKQFVKSICPEAYAKKYYCHGYMICGTEFSVWDTTANTANKSWSLAAERIKKDMIHKLEN